MNTTSYMDKQIMDLSSSSPQTKEFMDLMGHNNYHHRPHQDHAVVDDDDDDEDQTTVVHGGASHALSNNDDILASYDFQPIRPVAGPSATGGGGGSSSSQSQSFDLGASARVWNSGDSKPKTTASPTRNYGSLDSIEPAKFVQEKDHQGSFDSAIIAEIDRTMKKHSDNLMHALDGVSARLTQLETRTRQLESSVDDLKVSVGNNHGTSDGKMRQLENILREVQSGVLVIKDKQEIVESQLQLAKLQLSKPVDHHLQEAQTHHVATPVDSVLTSAASAPQQPHQNPPPSVNLPPPQPPFPVNIPLPQPPFQVNLPPPPQLPAQFPQTQIPQRDPYFPGPTQTQEPPTQQYQIPPPHQQFQPTPQPQHFSQPPPPPVNPTQIPPQLSHHSEDVPPQTYPPPPPPPSHRQPQGGPHQYYGGPPPPPPPNVYDQPPPPPPSSRPIPGHSFGYGPPPPPPPTGLNDPYHYGGSPSQYSMNPQQISSPTASQGGGGGGGGGGYPQLPTARVLPHAMPAAGSGGGGSGGSGSSGGSGNRVPVDDVIDKVTTMGFSRDLVRATVRKLTENGQSVDLNIVLDKLMNDGDGQPPRGWFGR